MRTSLSLANNHIITAMTYPIWNCFWSTAINVFPSLTLTLKSTKFAEMQRTKRSQGGWNHRNCQYYKFWYIEYKDEENEKNLRKLNCRFDIVSKYNVYQFIRQY